MMGYGIIISLFLKNYWKMKYDMGIFHIGITMQEAKMALKCKRSSWIAGLAALTFLTLAGCGTTASVGSGNEETDAPVKEDKNASAAQVLPYNIPPEYMPPPGKCRIWFPGRPPERQPPPGECADLERQVPLNTWLLRGAEDQSGKSQLP